MPPFLPAGVAAVVNSVNIKAGAYSVTVALSTQADTGSDEALDVFATLPATNTVLAAGTELFVKFGTTTPAHDVYTRYYAIPSDLTLQTGRLNRIDLTCTNTDQYAGKDDDGTAAHPYLLGDRHQLNKMRDLLDEGTRVYFKLIDDIDLSEVASWIPVSTGDNYPLELDGAGHTILNMTVNNASSTYPYSGFFGYLWGYVHDVVFDGAHVNGGAKNSGIVMGRSAASSHAADLSNVTVKNSSLTSSNNYVGALAGYVKKSNFIRNCKVINTTVTGTAGNVNPSLVGGLVGELTPNGSCIVSNCSAENVTVAGGCTNYLRSGVGGLIGQISAGTVTMYRCHSTGTLTTANTNNVGGLVGFINGTPTVVSITHSYSSCSVPNSYTFAGGLVGQCAADVTVTIDHCFASGDISPEKGYGGKGGLVGAIQGSGVTVKRSIAWNGTIKGVSVTTGDISSGAVVGFTHPNCVLTDNYRNPGMSLSGMEWIPSANFDHADVNGTTAPLQRITAAKDESALVEGTTTDFADANLQKYFAYHGKHLPAATVVTADDANGWVATPDIPDASDPEAPGWSETPVNFASVLPGAITTEICPGVEWTTFHGTWEGQVRNINIIRTALNEHNSLGIYYDYPHYPDDVVFPDGEDPRDLDKKCIYLDAVAGTNGPMACCQFVRVNGVVERVPTDTDDWAENCALTIDEGNAVDIVKVNGNFDAATLPNMNVGCGGPLLVWKGNIQTYPDWANEDFIKTTHPRTALGLSKDGKTVIQVTVDGRWTSSSSAERAIGMPTDLLSQLMKALGCYKAMNLDGGGGTAMWVYGYGNSRNIVNHVAVNVPDWNGTNLRATGNAVYIKSDLK